MASTPPTEPDPRTAADDDEDATTAPGTGVSSPDPVEGPDEHPESGSPAG